MEFLIPGLVAMSSMTQAFAISSEINIARFYWHIFEAIQAAPVSDISYVVGEVLAGMTRAILAILVILVLGLLFGVVLSCNIWFWITILLNSFVFASGRGTGHAGEIPCRPDPCNQFRDHPHGISGGNFFPGGEFSGLGPESHFSSAPDSRPHIHQSRIIRQYTLYGVPFYSGRYWMHVLLYCHIVCQTGQGLMLKL